MGTAKRERQKQNRQARLAQAQAAAVKKRRFKVVRNFAILAVVLVGIGAFVALSGDDDQVTAGATTSVPPVTDASGSTIPTSSTATTVPGEIPEFTYGTTACPAADGSSPRTITFTDAFQQCIDPAKTYTATFATSEGNVVVALDTTATPGTANNFVALGRFGYYDATDLFRTDPSIGIIQGGSPTTQSASDPGPGYDLPDEGFVYPASGAGGPYSYEAGDLVMARSATPNGAGAQFFFCVNADCANLDQGGVYVPFGTVVEGLDVLEAILALHAPDDSGLGGAPSRQVTVESVEITEA